MKAAHEQRSATHLDKYEQRGRSEAPLAPTDSTPLTDGPSFATAKAVRQTCLIVLAF
jgi:hypothetical protein